MSASTADDLRVWLELPGEAPHGSPIGIALRIENTSSEPIELYLHGRPVAFDIVVRRTDGTTLWRRLHEAIIPAILQVRVLQPGEVLTFNTRWEQVDNDGALVPPGDYALHGEIAVDASRTLLTLPVPLRITSRATGEKISPDRG